MLTATGSEKLREAADSHLADIDRLFSVSFDDEELATLATLLGRLHGGGEGETCPPGFEPTGLAPAEVEPADASGTPTRS